MVSSTAASDSPTLARSMRPADGSRYSGRKRGASASVSAITGMLSQNTDPQWKYSSSTPPTSGPMALPSENVAIHTPIANWRWRASWNMLRISAMVDGAMVAPARPSSARAAISSSAVWAMAASAEANAKNAAPSNSSRRRPMRSPSVPMVIRNPATKKP
ncbi:hypothetical protein AO056_04390 [Aeromonas hydrophila]|nr:hypothetical protein AO056_04390 [Aeromonas hydrophila]